LNELFVVLCENGLNRDENLLRGLLQPRATRIIPCLGPSLDDKAARVFVRVAQASGTRVVLVVHRDADDESLNQRYREIDSWIKRHDLAKYMSRLVRCVPVPCSERWLCFGAGLRVESKSTVSSCSPWKKRWEKERAPEWQRLEAAIGPLRAKGAALPDFAKFLAELGASQPE